MASAEKALVRFLRCTAAVLSAALGAVVMPSAWMNVIHESCGLGTLPDQPLVGYLTRSLSALYAALGVCCWHIATDVRRYLPLLEFAVPLALIFGGILVAIDVAVAMPWPWTVTEGLFLLGWSLALGWLLRRFKRDSQ